MNINSQNYATVILGGPIQTVSSVSNSYEQSLSLSFGMGDHTETVTIKFNQATLTEVLKALAGLVEDHAGSPEDSYHSYYAK
jgi:hypothetical protein